MELPKEGEIRKPTKTKSGVTPIAVMLPPRECDHGTCLYCPKLESPQSYTPKSPAVLRANALNYDPYAQVKARLKAFNLMNHPRDKIELIIMGGTFLQHGEKFQIQFIKGCYDALNDCESKNLEEAKLINETATHRCIALCIETRPDVCTQEHINQILKLGATRVELGVQIIDDKIYKQIKRGHTVKDVIDATKRLKDCGFKIGYHIMPGLPGSNIEKDIQLIKQLFEDPNFKPDQIKIYPCQVLKGAELEKLYNQGKYKPYTEEETKQILIQIMKIVPPYCRVMRVMREIPPDYLICGLEKTHLRQEVERELRQAESNIQEIRYREIGFNKTQEFNIKIEKIEYKASNGKEIFFQAINSENKLFGLLRLRIPSDPQNPLIPELKDAAIVRELHVYGKQAKIGSQEKVQHQGIGKQLLKQAEKYTKNNNINKVAIISGIGVREYYRKRGYKLDTFYMIKEI